MVFHIFRKAGLGFFGFLGFLELFASDLVKAFLCTYGFLEAAKRQKHGS